MSQMRYIEADERMFWEVSMLRTLARTTKKHAHDLDYERGVVSAFDVVADMFSTMESQGIQKEKPIEREITERLDAAKQEDLVPDERLTPASLDAYHEVIDLLISDINSTHIAEN